MQALIRSIIVNFKVYKEKVLNRRELGVDIFDIHEEGTVRN